MKGSTYRALEIPVGKQMSSSEPAPPSSKPWPWLTAIVFFVLCLLFFGRDLNFSAYAHPDESSKIDQIVHTHYNFNHPLLMLNSARLVADVSGKSSDFEAVKLIGRSVSVVYASLAVSILALVMGRLYGSVAAIATGLFVMTNPRLFEYAHYFKEEPTLLVGISLSLLSMVIYSEKSTVWTAGLLGAATALAFAGKYAGIIILPFSIYMVFAFSKNRPRDLGILLAGFLIVFVLVNLPAFQSLTKAFGRLDREVEHLRVGKEVARKIPHGIYTDRYWHSATPVLLGLLALYAWSLFKRGFKIKPIEWVLTLVPTVYFAILSFIPMTLDRYFLPCGVLLACLSAAGLTGVLQFKHGKWIALALIVLSVGWQVPRLYDANEGFSHDHLGELVQFMNANLPADSVILVGKGLRAIPLGPFKISNHQISHTDTLDSLRKEGITHLIVSPRNNKYYMNRNSNLTRNSDEEFKGLKSLYETLFIQGQLLREWKAGSTTYPAREIRLYSIKQVENAPESRDPNQRNK